MKKLLLLLLLLLCFPKMAEAQVGLPYDSLSGVQGFVPIRCALNQSIATTSTLITGCEAPAQKGARIWIKSIQLSASAISTAANFFILQYGTGGTCATPTVVWNSMSLAFDPINTRFPLPIPLAVNTELCILHAAAGTKNVYIEGYLAPAP